MAKILSIGSPCSGGKQKSSATRLQTTLFVFSGCEASNGPISLRGLANSREKSLGEFRQYTFLVSAKHRLIWVSCTNDASQRFLHCSIMIKICRTFLHGKIKSSRQIFFFSKVSFEMLIFNQIRFKGNV
jgi:hypothetical protein